MPDKITIEVDANAEIVINGEAYLPPKKQDKVWKPEAGERYFVIDGYGYIRWQIYKNNKNDNFLYSSGEMFRTQEEAERARNKQLAKMRIIRALREHEGDWEADWDNEYQNKFLCYYDYSTKTFDVYYNFDYKMIGSDYLCSSYAAWHYVLENMQEDLKICFGVK